MHQRVQGWFRRAFSALVPCDRAEENPAAGGDPAALPPPGGEIPAPDADARLIAQAEALEAANAKIRELEQNREAAIRTEAERMVMELLPDDPRQTALPAGAQQQREAAPYQQPYAAGTPREGDSDLSIEERFQQQLEELRAGQAALRDDLAGRDLDSQIQAYQQKYPRMDRLRVQTFLANQGPQAANVNLDMLCRLSHEKETQRLDGYAQRYHQEQLAKLRTSGQPPPLPGRGAGAPNEIPKITRDNATKTFVELARAAGYGNRS